MNNTTKNDIMIQTIDLVKTYEDGKIQAVRGISLTIKRGEFVAIMGPSGCGKSTLLNMLGTLDKPTSGEIIIDGTKLSTVKDFDEFRSRKIGFIFQSFYLLPTLTALENVQIPLIETIKSSKERIEKAKKLLKTVGLEGRMDQLPNNLSGGERQRVAIARSLANDPPIILGDEPTGNLDSKNSENVIRLLQQELRKEREVTLVVVTHDPNIAKYADRTIRILDGQIVEG